LGERICCHETFFKKYYGKLEIINDGYVTSQPYKCLWIRGFSGLAGEPLAM